MLRVLCVVAPMVMVLAVGCASRDAALKLDQAKAETAELASKLLAVEADNARLKTETKDTAQLKTDLAKTTRELADLKAKYEKLDAGLVEELKDMPGVAVDKKGAIEVSGLSFKLGGTELTAESKTSLEKVGTALATRKGLVYVDGYTDNVPVERPETVKLYVDNLGLSLARAAAVARVLEAAKVASERLVVRGFGSQFPIAPNDTAEGREKNRRVEIRLVPDQAAAVKAD